jgi:C-terminal processing protease CtpA/Prc
MNKSEFKTNTAISVAILCASLLTHSALWAADADEEIERQRQAQLEREQTRAEELRQRQEEMLAAIEETRMEAERAAEEARLRAEKLRVEAEQLRAEAEELRKEAGEQRAVENTELARVREEISRTHRELRRASQEVAKAHRALAITQDRRIRATVVNLGDRAMLGVILGPETADGIKIVGISPDGPAERAGLETRDVLVSLAGAGLGDGDGRRAREIVYEIMSEVDDGEDIQVGVLRDGKHMDFTVTPEKREPASWASYIQISEPPVAPDAPEVAGVAPSAPAAPVAITVEQIEVPPVDVTAIVAEAEALAEEWETLRLRFDEDEFQALAYEYAYDFDPESFSELGSMAVDGAHFWYTTAATHGVRFTEINEGLGSYFDTNRGLLVLDAPEDNAFGLRPGDVLLEIGGSEVNSTSDIIRALRDYDAGDPVTIVVRREKKDEILDVQVPENRFGLIGPAAMDFHADGHVSPEIAED